VTFFQYPPQSIGILFFSVTSAFSAVNSYITKKFLESSLNFDYITVNGLGEMN